jgi:acetoacetyl-CoA synthetase
MNDPLWSPSPKRIAESRLAAFQTQIETKEHTQFSSYHALWQWSVAKPADFWSYCWDFCGVIGEKKDPVFAPHTHFYQSRYFPNSLLNWAENCLTNTIDPAHPAVIFRHEKSNDQILSWNDLRGAVAKTQEILKKYNVQKGDRVAALMPNCPETLIFALATASLGAIFSSASPDFGVQGVLDRFGQIEPKILVSVDGYYYGGKIVPIVEKLAHILPQLPSVERCILVDFLKEEHKVDYSLLPRADRYTNLIQSSSAHTPSFERVEFNHPLFIMFSSGTTGIPKCIVHGHGGTLIQHLKEHQLQCDIKPLDRVFYFTTCGWMMWNWQMTALASGATLLMYDGSPFYPKIDSLWDFTTQHHCTLFGTGAKYIDGLKANHVSLKDRYDLSALRTITSTGSPLVHESFDYVYQHIKSDLHLASISGGTDIVSCFVLGNAISPVYRGEIQGAGLGMNVDSFDNHGRSLGITKAQSGELVCKSPFPSQPIYFWNDQDFTKYKKAYFEKFENIWCHGDWIEITDHQGFIIHGRSDATLNPGGVRIGTAEIYRQVEQFPEVLEALAIGQIWKDDERVILFVRLKDGIVLDEDLSARIKKQIKDGASPRHVPAKILQIADIPRTKSNKIVELAVRDIIHNREVKNIEALANPEALELYRNLEALKV